MKPIARIAQLVEQLAFNQLVLGSSPSPRTFREIAPLTSGVFCARASMTIHQEDWDENLCEAPGLTAPFASSEK